MTFVFFPATPHARMRPSGESAVAAVANALGITISRTGGFESSSQKQTRARHASAALGERRSPCNSTHAKTLLSPMQTRSQFAFPRSPDLPGVEWVSL